MTVEVMILGVCSLYVILFPDYSHLYNHRSLVLQRYSGKMH